MEAKACSSRSEIVAEWQVDRLWSDDKAIKLLDAESGATTATWEVEDWKTDSSLLVWSPDDEKLALVGPQNSDHALTIWNVADGKPLVSRKLGIGGSRNGGCWSSDSQLFAVGNNLYDLKGGQTRLGVGEVLAWPASGTLLSAKSPTLVAPDGKLLSTLPGDFTYGGSTDAQFSPDGRWLAVISEHGDLTRVWDVRERRLHVTLCHDDTLPAFAISGDGHYRADGDLGDELLYVAVTDAGQETLSPAEFEQRFGWKNDPTKVNMPKVEMPNRNTNGQ